MAGRQILAWAGAALLPAMLALSVWVTRQGATPLAEAPRPSPAKAFLTGVAEEVRLRDFQHFGVDLLAFKACRIEKLRRGAISFGAFNVLALDSVTVNLPADVPNASDVKKLVSTNNEGMTPRQDAAEDFIGLFKSVRGLTGKKFSGVRISGLEVNRWADGKAERLFAVKTAEGGIGVGEHIRLEGCVVYAPGGAGDAVGTAKIVLKPQPTLVYQKGGAEHRLPLQSLVSAPSTQE